MVQRLKLPLHRNCPGRRHTANSTRHRCPFLKVKASAYRSIFGLIFNTQQNYLNVGYRQMDESRNDVYKSDLKEWKSFWKYCVKNKKKKNHRILRGKMYCLCYIKITNKYKIWPIFCKGSLWIINLTTEQFQELWGLRLFPSVCSFTSGHWLFSSEAFSNCSVFRMMIH